MSKSSRVAHVHLAMVIAADELPINRVINDDPQFPRLVDLPFVDGRDRWRSRLQKRLAVDRLSRHIGVGSRPASTGDG